LFALARAYSGNVSEGDTVVRVLRTPKGDFSDLGELMAACAAAGRLKDPAFIPLLKQLLKHPFKQWTMSPDGRKHEVYILRHHAKEALEKFGYEFPGFIEWPDDLRYREPERYREK
jgi:HEAT repeat protein